MEGDVKEFFLYSKNNMKNTYNKNYSKQNCDIKIFTYTNYL
jgi:hypothetical protein